MLRARSLFVLVDTPKDCSSKPIILCTLKTRIKRVLPLKELRALPTVFYRRTENSGRSSQIRRLPIEHSWVSTKRVYTITTILRALWFADARYLLEGRCTNDVTAWRDSRAWSKPGSVSLGGKVAGKDFQNIGQNKTKIFSFGRRLQWKASRRSESIHQSDRHLTQPKMPEVCLEKTIKAAWKLCCRRVCRRPGKWWMAAIELFQL